MAGLVAAGAAAAVPWIRLALRRMTSTSAVSAASAMTHTTIATVSRTPLFKSHPFRARLRFVSPDGHTRLPHMPRSEGYFAQES